MRTLAITTLLLLAAVIIAQPAPILLLKQERDQTPAEHLLASELATLGDPFFQLVLKDHADTTSVPAVLNLIQPDMNKRQVFVVDENIASPERRGARRVVIAFSGTNNGNVLDTNVMATTFLTPENFPASPVLEVWGWDNQRGRYNYYKLDDSGTPDRRFIWKFRASSVDADLRNRADRQDTCLACHINGGPIMKELLFPWNNWHSTAAPVVYLQSTGAANIRWPVATTLTTPLRGAEDLEQLVIPAIRQFNTRRLNIAISRRDDDGSTAVDQDGFARITDGRRLLRHLFVTTEYNLISAKSVSGLHAFAPGPQQGPAESVTIPNSFFVNANLIGGGGVLQYQGLGIKESQEFAGFAKITRAEYQQLVQQSGVQLGGKDSDTFFAWFTPEPSHMDNDAVDRLLKRGVISPAFVAAVLAVDLEIPVLSAPRAALFQFVPDTFRFHPQQAPVHPDDLTKIVIKNLETQAPPADSTAAKFLSLLQDPDPVQRLRERVIALRDEEKKRLAGATTRPQELQRLYEQMLQRRAAVVHHEVLGTINETEDRLLPLPLSLRRQQTHFNTEN